MHSRLRGCNWYRIGIKSNKKMSNPLNGARNGFIKAASVLTSVATLVSLSGFAALAPLATSAAVPSDYGLKEGDTVSATGSSDPDVYIVNALGYKRLFLNPVIFGFYGHLGGFSKVKSVSATARDAFPTSGLFRNCETNDQKVWAVEVTGEDTGTLHWVNLSGDAAVAQDANFFKKVFCINNNEANWYTKSSVAYTALSQVPVYSRVGTPSSTPVAGGSVMASLAPDNPSSGTVIAGQGVASLAHFRLTNTNSYAVAVNSLTFQKQGVAGDSTFANTYVFTVTPGTTIYGTRLTDANTPSSGVINFTGGTSSSTIITVPAGGYVDIAFRSDVAASTGGQTMGVSLTSVNGATVSGLSGNLFTVASAPSDLASAQFAASTSLIPATAGVTSDPLKDTVVWQDTVSINSKNILLRRFALRQTNSINSADVSNFRLLVDGNQVAQVQNLDTNGYVTFVMPTPATLLTGTRTIKVLADITGGTSRKLTMSLRSTADVGMLDSNYGTGVTATLPSGTFPLTAGDITINSGSIVVQKDSTSPSGNVVKGGSDVPIGRWTFTSYGEPTKVSTLTAGVHTGTGTEKAFRNGRIMAYPVGNSAAAQQFGSTTTLVAMPTGTSASTSYTVNLTINPGTPMIVELRADIYDNVSSTDVTAATDTFTADLYTGSGNGQGMVSLATSNVPTARVDANQMTIQAGSATISKYANFTDQTITTPSANKKIGDFVVTGSTNEAINVNTLTLDVTVGAGANINNLSNVYLKWNGVPTSVKSTVTATGNSYSISNATLPINSSVHVEVYADLGTITAGSTATIQTKVAVSGITAQSAQTVNTQANGTSSTAAAVTFSGQTLTVAAATITTALDAGTPVARNITAQGSTDVSKFNFTATNDNSIISELQLKTAASSSQQGIASVTLKKSDGTVVGTLPLTQSGASQFATFGGLNLIVPANDPNGLSLTATVTTGTVGFNSATTGLNVAVTLDYIKSAPQSTGVIATDSTDRAGNAQYLYNAIPVVTAPSTLPQGALLVPAFQDVVKFTIAPTGTANAVIGWNTVLLTVAKNTNPKIASSGMVFLEDGVDITSNVEILTNAIGTGQTTGWIRIKANNAAGEFQVPAAGHTYELKANITNASTAGDNIAVTVTQPSSHISVTTRAGAAFNTASASFVWTDRTDNSHSTSSIDWENDYLIKTLNFTQVLSR
jgi:hypothetical protein